MARTRRADYQRSNRIRTLPLDDPEAAAVAASRVLRARDAADRQRFGTDLLAQLAAQTGAAVPELVVPDEHQPHRRSGGRIVYSLQGDYRRRAPSPGDPSVARGGRPLGRIRVLNRTPARGDLVRRRRSSTPCCTSSATMTTPSGSASCTRSTLGVHARLRHLRDQIEAAEDGLDETAAADPLRPGRAVDALRPAAPLIRALPAARRRDGAARGRAGRRPSPPAARAAWSIILAR